MFALILVVALAFAGSLILNRRIYETLPVAVFVTTLGVYVLALVMQLNVAVWICSALIALATVACILRKWKRGNYFSDRTRAIVTLVVTITICLLFCILLSDHRVFFYDDLSYWGLYTKNIFCIDKLPYLFENCSVDYKDYTPIMQVLQYIAMFGRKSFHEGVMFQTNVCFIYIMLLPILTMGLDGTGNEDKENEDKGHGKPGFVRIAAVIMYVIFPHILTAQFYYRLGVDLLLSLVFGYVLYYVFLYETCDKLSEWFRMIAIVTGLAFLALIKSSGIVLALLAVVMLLVREAGSGSSKKIVAGKTALAAAFALGSYYLWQLFLRYSGNNGYLSNRVKDSVGSGAFSFPPYTREVVLNYIKHFFIYPLTRNRIGATAFTLVIFLILTFVCGSCGWPQGCHKASSADAKRRGLFERLAPCRTGHAGLAMFVLSITGLLIFCLAHIGMYLFVFDEWEAHGLMEFDRYITQYLGGIFFLYVCKLIKDVHENNAKSGKVLLAVSTAVFIALLPYADMITYLVPGNYRAAFDDGNAQMAQRAEDEWNASGIAELNLAHDGTQKLTVVADAWDETTQFMEYAAVPQPINRIVNVPATEAGSVNGYIMDFVDEYVYVCNNAPDAYPGDWSETAQLTDDGTPLKGGSLYAVDRTGDEKILRKIKQ